MVMTTGNHEERIGGVSVPIKQCKTYSLGENVIMAHGHEKIRRDANCYIVGHSHPTKNGNPVFLHHLNGYKSTETIICPAFGKYTTKIDMSDKIRDYDHFPILRDEPDRREYDIYDISESSNQ